MGVAMARMLQSEPWPWWSIVLLVIGGITLIAGLLILTVSPRRWKSIGCSIIGFPGWIHRTYIWLSRGPQWSISKPILSPDEITPSNINSVKTNFTTTLSLVIKNRDDYPLEGALYSLEVNVEQRLGRIKVRCALRPNPSYQITIQPHQEGTYKLFLFGACSSHRCLDVTKPYNWGIQGISVSLNGAGYKDLHRGLYCKPIPQVRIGTF